MSAFSLAKTLARTLGLDTRALYQRLSAASIRAALIEQGLAKFADELRQAVPDISDQYSTPTDPLEFARYWEVKTRGLHAFQTRATLDALDAIGLPGIVIADIGDSSGNHAAYIRALAGSGKVGRMLGINLDPIAVNKIRAKGGEAMLCRAEDLDLAGIRPDLFLSFETLEHLTDPVRFLHNLAGIESAEWLLFTVPWQRVSRFGGDHLRGRVAVPGKLTAEQVHIWELSPSDWALLARFAGWAPVWIRFYRQYPVGHPLVATRTLWRVLDHEGFIAILTRRDLSLANRYADW